jgi:glycine cleavage system H protein
MSDTRYTKTHEWVRLEQDGNVTVGITDHAQDQMGDIVYVELPEVGKEVKTGAEVAVVESVKAASDIYVPVNGRVIAVNERLQDEPELVNSGAEGDGWFLKLAPDDPAEMEQLMDKETYETFLESE